MTGTVMSAVLHTIGYEGESIESFLSTLQISGVSLLIDVRDVPISRKKGFSKRLLSKSLQCRGIDYLHLKGLGDPKPGRIAARDGRYEEFRRIFGNHLLTDAAQSDLTCGVSAAKARSACLLCYERDHRHCHRSIVAEEMARLGGFKLLHLEVRQSDPSASIMGTAQRSHGIVEHVG